MTKKKKIWDIMQEACFEAWEMGNANNENTATANEIVDNAIEKIMKVKE